MYEARAGEVGYGLLNMRFLALWPVGMSKKVELTQPWMSQA